MLVRGAIAFSLIDEYADTLLLPPHTADSISATPTAAAAANTPVRATAAMVISTATVCHPSISYCTPTGAASLPQCIDVKGVLLKQSLSALLARGCKLHVCDSDLLTRCECSKCPGVVFVE